MCNKGTREGLRGTCAYRYSFNHTIKMVVYQTQERDDDVVDSEHKEDGFEDSS